MAHQLFIEAFDYDNAGAPIPPEAPFIQITDDTVAYGTGHQADMKQAMKKTRLKHRKVPTTNAANRKPQPLARLVTIPKPVGASVRKEIVINAKHPQENKMVLKAYVEASGRFTVKPSESVKPGGKTKSKRVKLQIFRNADKSIKGVLFARGQTRVCIVPV